MVRNCDLWQCTSAKLLPTAVVVQIAVESHKSLPRGAEEMRTGRHGLFCIVLLYCLRLADSRFWPLNDRASEDDDLLVDILRKVLRTSRTRNVLLIYRANSPLDGRASDILGKISAATARRVPTFYVKASWTEPEEFQVSPYAPSRDLLVYIYVSQRELDIVESELVADDLRNLAHTRYQPKVLLMMILRQPLRDLAGFFYTMWTRRILDAIVVEHNTGHANQRSTSTIVHRYNPFVEHHTEEPYSPNATIEWFTDDFPNMQGYLLPYAFTRRPPYSDVTLAATEQTTELKGVDWMVVQTLAGKMNFSDMVHVVRHNIYIRYLPNGSYEGMIPDMFEGRYEVLFNTFPIFINWNMKFTDNVDIEEYCFVVPNMLKWQKFLLFNNSGFRLILASVSLLGIVWLCARFIRLDPNRWHPLKILGIMLTSSFPPAPTKLHERIIFLSIFLACSRYSSSFFAELMSITLDNEHNVRFDHLSDLVNSPLSLMMYSDMMDIITEIIVDDNISLRSHVGDLSKKIMSFDRTDVCLEMLLMHQNVSCLVEQGWGKLAVVNNMRDGESKLRTTKLCYLSAPTGYMFMKGSPYIGRVNELLLMLAEGGIRDKWHRDYLRNETRELSEDETENRTNLMYVGMFWPIFSVLRLGYSLSILVFVGELIWKRLNVCWRQR